VTIDHCFDFLRMYFQATDVDDPISPAYEIIAVTTQIEHVARIHEAVRGCERLDLVA
jgi:hypothetical protein